MLCNSEEIESRIRVYSRLLLALEICLLQRGSPTPPALARSDLGL